MFSYFVRVFPHHTDYAGIVWHGTYVTWMEEARVEYLRTAGVSFEQLVMDGVDLPVIDIALRYHHGVKMGEDLEILVKLNKPDRLRLNFSYELKVADRICVSANVTIVAVDTATRKVLRRLPDYLQAAIARFSE
jgi:acyl-CoA thioester hydrolase